MAPPDQVRWIDSPDQAKELAAWLVGPHRRHPVVVVSIPAGKPSPWIDADAILDAVRGVGEVVVLPTDASSWAFSDALPAGTQVYGGAGRVYPVGTTWTVRLEDSPLRFAYGPADATRATERLISDALRMIALAGPATGPGRAVTSQVSGVVGQVVEPSRAIVTLDDGGLATIWQELTLQGVTIGQLVAPGQRVTGALDHEGRLDVTAGLRRGKANVAHYRPGDVVLARVSSVRPDVVQVDLHPGVTVAVRRERVTTNPSDSLRSLFSTGEVVVARVDEPDGGLPTLRFDDVDDEDVPRESSALLDGGPPWLTAPEPMVGDLSDTDDDVAASSSAGAPGHGTGTADSAMRSGPGTRTPAPRGAVQTLSLTVDAKQARIVELEAALESTEAAVRDLDDLRQRVRGLEKENARLHHEAKHLRARLLKETQRFQKAARARGPATIVEPAPRGRLFLDDADQYAHDLRQLEHEIYTEWTTLIPPEQKSERPLDRYSVGPEFLDSLSRLEGVSRDKVVRVIVEVLTGLADELDSRQVHPLREGSAGNSPAVIRPGGWTCYRVALQRETPGARRLMYWRRGNEYELARVAHHDDMDP